MHSIDSIIRLVQSGSASPTLLDPHSILESIKQYDELSRFVQEEVGRNLEKHQRLEAKHAELSREWDRLIRVRRFLVLVGVSWMLVGTHIIYIHTLATGGGG